MLTVARHGARGTTSPSQRYITAAACSEGTVPAMFQSHTQYFPRGLSSLCLVHSPTLCSQCHATRSDTTDTHSNYMHKLHLSCVIIVLSERWEGCGERVDALSKNLHHMFDTEAVKPSTSPVKTSSNTLISLATKSADILLFFIWPEVCVTAIYLTYRGRYITPSRIQLMLLVALKQRWGSARVLRCW